MAGIFFAVIFSDRNVSYLLKAGLYVKETTFGTYYSTNQHSQMKKNIPALIIILSVLTSCVPQKDIMITNAWLNR